MTVFKLLTYLDFNRTAAMSFLDEPPYLKKFGLKEPPYSTKPNERFLYLTPTHQEALAMVGKIMRDREGSALVYGKFGTGKTTLMRKIYTELRNHPEEFQVAVIENAGHCPTEFQLAGEIIESFEHKSQTNDRKDRSDQIKILLLENYKRYRMRRTNIAGSTLYRPRTGCKQKSRSIRQDFTIRE